MVAAPRRAWHAACAPSAFHTWPTWCPAVARVSCGRRSTALHSSCSSHRVWDDAREGWRQPRIKRAGLARVPPLQRAGARRQQPHSAPHSRCKGLHSSCACCAPVARTRNRSQVTRARVAVRMGGMSQQAHALARSEAGADTAEGGGCRSRAISRNTETTFCATPLGATAMRARATSIGYLRRAAAA